MIKPHKRPTVIGTNIESKVNPGEEGCIDKEVIAQAVIIAPIDKSKLPPINTIVIPIQIIPNIDACLKTFN